MFDYSALKRKWTEEKRQRISQSKQLKRRVIEKGTPLFKRYGIRKVVLFGSVAEGHVHSRSDIDILVMPLNADYYWDFQHDFQEALDVQVDIYTDHDDPVFIEKIIARGETLYDV